MEEEKKKKLKIGLAVAGLSAATTVGACLVYHGVSTYHESRKEYASLQSSYAEEDESAAEVVTEAAAEAETEDAAEAVTEAATEAETEEEIVSPVFDQYTLNVDAASLKAINPDYVGWLSFSDGNVSYPVVRNNSDDTEKYLEETFEGEQNAAGSIFIDGYASDDFSDLNTIIYGHNMKNGTMFGGLKNLYNVPGTMTNPYFFIDMFDRIVAYHVFAIAMIPGTSDLYRIPQNLAAYEDYVSELSKVAAYYDPTAITIQNMKPLVTMSTCYGAEGTPNRLIVVGVEETEKRR